MTTPILDQVLHPKNGAPKVTHDSTIRAFSSDEQSVLGMLVPQTRDLVAMHWSSVNSLLYVPDLFAIQQAKNRPLFRRGRTLWDQMALDDLVASALRAWVGFLIQDVRVIPAGDTAEARFVADAITAMLRSMPGGTLGTINELVSSGAKHGFSVSECDYGVASSGAAQGWFAVTNIRTQLPHFLFPVHDEEGRLLGVNQIDPYNQSQVRTIEPDKMLHWVINPDTDSFAGGSLLAPAHQHWVAKQLMLQLRNENAEWNSGRLEVDHTDEEGRILSEAQFKVRANELISNYLRFRGYKVWRGMAVKLVQSTTSPDLFNTTIRDADQAIARSIGPPWLVMEEGVYGTRAQSEVHASTFETTIRPIREYTAELLREGPIRRVCEMNGWALRHRPDITLEKAPEADQQQTIQAFLQAVQAGIVKPQASDADEIRGRLGWPLTAPPEPGADDAEAAAEAVSLNGAQIQSAVAIISQITQAGLPPDAALAMLTSFLPISSAAAERIIGPLRGAPVAPAMPAAPPAFAEADAEFSAMGDIWREIKSKHPDWSEAQVIAVMLSKARRAGITNTEAHFTAALPKLPLELLEDKAAPAIDAAWQKATVELAEKARALLKLGTLSPAAMIRHIRNLTMDLEPVRAQLEEAVLGAWDIGQQQATKDLKKAGAKRVRKFDAPRPGTPTLQDFKALLKSRSFKAVNDLSTQAMEAIAKKLETIYSSGITLGEAELQADRLFKDLIESGSIEPGTPGADVTYPSIRSTVVRTNMSSAFGEARMELYERNSDFVVGLERMEVADGHDGDRSHPLSAVADGLRIKLSDPRVRYITGPTHFNDRGVSAPITTLDADESFRWSTDAEIDAFIAAGRELSPRFF